MQGLSELRALLSEIVIFTGAVLQDWKVLLTGSLSIAVVSLYEHLFAPIAARIYWAIVIASLLIAFFRAWQKACRERDALARGDLRITILHFDYNEETGKLESQIMFSNDDVISQRTIIGVNFIYRVNSSESGFEVFATGPSRSFFIGHIDPVPLSPRAEEIRRYEASVPSSKFAIIGAQAGLHITFSVPARPTDNAEVVAMEIIPSQLTLPGRGYPNVERISLDSISQGRQIEQRQRDLLLSRRPIRFLTWKKMGAIFDY